MKRITFITFFLLQAVMVTAVAAGYMLELSSQLIYTEDDFNANLYAVPELSLQRNVADNLLSANLQLMLNLDDELEIDADIYRFWVRFSTSVSEVRLGRQHLNFGPAQMMRSLQWFDYIDPNDVLEQTSGVDALLYRCFRRDSIFWIWAMLGKGESKGIEPDTLPSADNKIEIGGRCEFPALKGNLGLTGHHRPSVSRPSLDSTEEFRFAVDGRWDFEAGLWFEKAVSFYRSNPAQESTYLTIGGDYSFSGFVFTLEHFLVSPNLIGSDKFYHHREQQTSGLAAAYSINTGNHR